MTTEYCQICKRAMDQPGARDTVNCGGDCLRCVAEAGDPDCLKVMRELEPTNEKWESKNWPWAKAWDANDADDTR
ncbi:hypothetical protein [Ralstonia sp. ASV6]|uniref:hypothetical protein n=1 Tax=Ralstonia sp. ASV6 TaxID=2795124 RepID=UPI0018EB4815|nr:hypothetical protein [Ralstonia sp. ASV6]